MKQLTQEEKSDLLAVLEERFEANMHRHPTREWAEIEEQLIEQESVLWSLNEMEKTGGEPDVVGIDNLFMDCAKESPTGRRSLCYDRPALDARKKNKPENDAVSMAEAMGIELLSTELYYFLQSFEEIDLKTSTWVQTPEHIRELGGALFCDRRYNTVFTYHNGAESYYASRGFRGSLTF